MHVAFGAGAQQGAEEGAFAHALDLSVDRQHVGPVGVQERQVVRHNAVVRITGPAEQLVEGRQRAGDFERLEHAPAEAREEGRSVARVTGVEEPGLVVDLAAAGVALPASRAGGVRLGAEDAQELGAGGDEFRAHRREVHRLHIILPAVVVVAVDAHFGALVAHRAHHVGVAAADVRRGQQRAVEQRAEAVHRDDAGAADLPEEARAEDARDRAAGLVGPEGEEKAGRHAKFAAVGGEVGHADPRAAVGVDVNLEREADGHDKPRRRGQRPRPTSHSSE